MLVGSDINRLRQFVRVISFATADRYDFMIGRELPQYYEIVGDTPEDGWEREANGNRDVPAMTTVLATFIGYEQVF